MSLTKQGDMFAGKPCEFINVRDGIEYHLTGGRTYIRPVGFPHDEGKELLGFIVAKPFRVVWETHVEEVTDKFFADKKTKSKLYSEENKVAEARQKVVFHPYMNEMTVHVVRELAPRAGTKDARFEVEDLSGRRGIVPKAWFKKEETVKATEFEYGLRSVNATALSTYVYSLEECKRYTAATGTFGSQWNHDNFYIVYREVCKRDHLGHGHKEIGWKLYHED